MRGRGSFLVLGAVLALAHAAHAQIRPPAASSPGPAPGAAAAVADDDLKAFAAGDVRRGCHLACAFRWGAARDDAAALYANGRWADLARFVLARMDDEDLTFFYLAVAAYHLGYIAAADKYMHIAYDLSVNSVWRCAHPFDECNGHVFPDEEVRQFSLILKAKRTASEAKAENTTP